MKRFVGLVTAVLCGVAISAVTGAGAAHATPGPWSVTPFQLPTDAPSGAYYRLGTSECAPAGPCVIPGFWRRTTSAPSKAFIGTITNGVQTATDVPPFSPNTTQELSKAACSASGACAAIGTYNDASVSFGPLLAVLTASGWQTRAAPKPAGSPAQAVLRLNDVACGGAECYALGTLRPSAPMLVQQVVERYANGRWTVTTLPAVAGATGRYELNMSIACASATRCVTAAFATRRTGGGPVAGVWDGTQWTTSILPLPAGGVTADIYSLDTACAPDGSCRVLGSYLTQESPRVDRMVDWVNTAGTWSTTALPKLAGTAYLWVKQVRCTAVDSCSAVAHWSDNGVNRRAVDATLTGGVWKEAYAPVPGDPTQFQDLDLDAMACVPGSGCSGFGKYYGDTTRTPLETTLTRMPTTTAMPFPPDAAASDYVSINSAYYDGTQEVVYGLYAAASGQNGGAVWTRTA